MLFPSYPSSGFLFLLEDIFLVLFRVGKISSRRMLEWRGSGELEKNNISRLKERTLCH